MVDSPDNRQPWCEDNPKQRAPADDDSVCIRSACRGDREHPEWKEKEEGRKGEKREGGVNGGMEERMDERRKPMENGQTGRMDESMDERRNEFEEAEMRNERTNEFMNSSMDG